MCLILGLSCGGSSTRIEVAGEPGVTCKERARSEYALVCANGAARCKGCNYHVDIHMKRVIDA